MILNRASLSVISIFISNFALAQKQACISDNWQCSGPLSISAGYVLLHQVYSKHHFTDALENERRFHYTPLSAYPNNLNGFRVGFSVQLNPEAPFAYHMYYTQFFNKTKVYEGISFSIAAKISLLFLEYSLNPHSRTKFSLLGGIGSISSFKTISTPTNNILAYSSFVDIDPIVGGIIAYQINSQMALKYVQLYDIVSYNKNVVGRVVPALMLNYFPNL